MAHYTVKKELERTIIFRLTEDQWQFLRRAAESQKTNLSEIARQIIEAARQRKILEERGADGARRKI